MNTQNAGNPLYITYEEEDCETGDSKFFGAPDLPNSFDWPCDEDGYDEDFICQVNCSDAHEINSLLPKKGMLYFFGCLASPLGYEDAPEIKPGFQSMENFCVIYSESDINDLQSGEIVDEDGEPAGFAELRIEFSDNEDDCTEAFHMMMGVSPDCELKDDLSDYILLFCLDSFSGSDFGLDFEDSGYLYFLIKKDDLVKSDFSKTICYLAV